MKIAIIGALAAMGLTLCGCNIVASPTPVFTAADAAGSPGLRPGLWVKPEADCNFDPKAKVADWPKCADPMVIEPERMVDPAKPKQAIDYVLATGEPRVLQIRLPLPDKGVGGGEAGAAVVKTLAEQIGGYIFVGVAPTRTDAQGRITEATTWISLCGPPPEPKDPKGPGDYASRTPFEGLTVNPKTGNCRPRDAAAVRRAAAGSRSLKPMAGADDKGETPAQVIRWVRD